MSPSAEIYLHRLTEMTRCEWKLREQSTLFGFFWTLLNPLIMYGILYMLFTQWMGGQMKNYASYLLIGVVLYGFFNTGTSYGLSSLRRRSPLLSNFKVPWELVVLSATLSIAASFLLEYGLMLLFLLFLGAAPNACWLLLPAFILIQAGFVIGLSLSLSVWNMRTPDAERIWNIAITAGFFLTPIFYTTDMVSPARQRLLRLNPMTHLIEMTRGCILDARPPSAATILALLLLSLAVAGSGLRLIRGQGVRLLDYK